MPPFLATFLLTLACIGFLDFKFSLAVGAGASIDGFVHQPRVSAVHTSGATFGQTEGIVVDGVGERPTAWGGREWAKMPTPVSYTHLTLPTIGG